MSEQLPKPEAILKSAMPSWASGIIPGAVWGVVAAMVFSLGVTGLSLLWRLWKGDELSLRSALFYASMLFVLVLPPTCILGMMRHSRALADRAFVGLGFLATFFGLAMLVVFFAQMGYDSAQFFRYMPKLVLKQNEELNKRVEDQERIIHQAVAAVKAEMAAEMKNAATPEERKETEELFLKTILPNKIADLKKNAEEFIVARDKGVRQDTSAWGVFWFFLTNGPSNLPQDAGVFPALIGSLYIGIITIFFAVPIGIGAAIYLEEYKQKSKFGRMLGAVIQININNLAGIPSVVYGIFGGWAFVSIFRQLEHRYPETVAARNLLGGGLTLALLTLPVVIVATQEAIRAVPDSIRHGAYAVGATQWQTIWHQVLPLAWPGILTGTILSLSRAIGEAAPLVLFGALLFVNQTPGLFRRFTVMPMQIFGWADRPAEVIEGESVEVWQYNAALAGIILLVMLLTLNAFAIWMRNRAQQKLKW